MVSDRVKAIEKQSNRDFSGPHKGGAFWVEEWRGLEEQSRAEAEVLRQGAKGKEVRESQQWKFDRHTCCASAF